MYDVVNRRWCPHHVLFVSVYISILPMSIFPPPPRLLRPPGYLRSDFFPTPRLLPPPFYFGLQSMEYFRDAV